MDKNELLKFICEMFNCDECNQMILRQINKYVKECGYNYLDIARALSYYVDIQGNVLDPKYGIAIVKFVVNDARRYYKSLEELKAQQMQAAADMKKQSDNPKIIKCKVNDKKTIKRNKIDISNM